jgi:hypothetical protein
MSGRKTGSRGVCVYCGHRRSLTSDHVPPKCLFGQKGNLPSDLITVPACERCNLKASGDDEYLRLVLTTSLEASEHVVATSLWPAVLRSLNRPEATGFARQFFQNVAMVDTFTRSGIYVGKMAAHRIDHERLRRIMERIIRGLFFAEYRKRLPRSHVVTSVFVNPLHRHVRRDEFEVWRHHVRELLGGGREKEVGRRALVYRCNRHPMHTFWSVWALTFFGNLHFIAFTTTPSQLQRAIAPPLCE